ncbi:MAG: GNAT family N-acetyltransferase [Deltaproteobacteria bacterium]
MSEATSTVTVRPAAEGDLEALGRLAAQLVRLHHEWDAARFLVVEPIEEGYRWWLGRELSNKNAVILVAVDSAANGAPVVGYAYGRLEERDWNALLDAHGALHDIFVDATQRGRGAARQLLEAMIARLGELGAPRVVLHTASQNEAAQRLFRAAGFRPTMIEMTRETQKT